MEIKWANILYEENYSRALGFEKVFVSGVGVCIIK
jgi:hypothetical protein